MNTGLGKFIGRGLGLFLLLSSCHAFSLNKLACATLVAAAHAVLAPSGSPAIANPFSLSDQPVPYQLAALGISQHAEKIPSPYEVKPEYRPLYNTFVGGEREALLRENSGQNKNARVMSLDRGGDHLRYFLGTRNLPTDRLDIFSRPSNVEAAEFEPHAKRIVFGDKDWLPNYGDEHFPKCKFNSVFLQGSLGRLSREHRTELLRRAYATLAVRGVMVHTFSLSEGMPESEPGLDQNEVAQEVAKALNELLLEAEVATPIWLNYSIEVGSLQVLRKPEGKYDNYPDMIAAEAQATGVDSETLIRRYHSLQKDRSLWVRVTIANRNPNWGEYLFGRRF